MSIKSRSKQSAGNKLREYVRQSDAVRRRELRANWTALPNDQRPTPGLYKFERKLRTLTLRQLGAWDTKLFRAASGWLRAFLDWRAEAPDAIPTEEWPDIRNFVFVQQCYTLLTKEFSRRKIAFTPREIVMPQPLQVLAPQAPAEDLPIAKALGKVISGFTTKLAHASAKVFRGRTLKPHN